MELPRNIRTLTGIRGFAALRVVFYHLRDKLSFNFRGDSVKSTLKELVFFYLIVGVYTTLILHATDMLASSVDLSWSRDAKRCVYNTCVLSIPIALLLLSTRRRMLSLFFGLLASSLIFGIDIVKIRVLGAPLRIADYLLVPELVRLFGNQGLAVCLVGFTLISLSCIAGMAMFLKREKLTVSPLTAVYILIASSMLIFAATSSASLLPPLSAESGLVLRLSDKFVPRRMGYGPISDHDNLGLPLVLAMEIYDRMASSEPEGYSAQRIRDLNESLRSDKSSTDDEHVKPDLVICIMVESYCELADFPVSFSREPTPFLDRLSENAHRGKLLVPGYANGTVRTEFEVLTGFDEDLHPRHIASPYVEVLKERTPPWALPSVLKSANYTPVAIHNNSKTFYRRNKFMPQLGFEKFLGIEDFQGIVRTNRYCTDDILVSEMLRVMDTTPGPLFIFAITMETHYPFKGTHYDGTDLRIRDSLIEKSAWDSIEYYANALNATDHAIERLINELTASPRNSLVVLFGDHLPPFAPFDAAYAHINSLPEKARDEAFHTVPFIVWSNYALRRNLPGRLEASQLYGLIIELAGAPHNSLSTLLMQKGGANYDRSTDELTDIDKNLTLLQFDVYSGECYSCSLED